MSHLNVIAEKGQRYNDSLPPDTVWLRYPYKNPSGNQQVNKTYAYAFREEIKDVENNEIDLKVPQDKLTFDFTLDKFFFQLAVIIYCFIVWF